jgi:hypothetical protein
MSFESGKREIMEKDASIMQESLCIDDEEDYKEDELITEDAR